MSKELKFARKKALSVPQLKLQVDKAYYIQISSQIREIELSTTSESGKKDRCRAVTVINLETGEENQLLLDSIPDKEFEAFGEALLGMKFEVCKGKKTGAGKSAYHPYTIYEIE